MRLFHKIAGGAERFFGDGVVERRSGSRDGFSIAVLLLGKELVDCVKEIIAVPLRWNDRKIVSTDSLYGRAECTQRHTLTMCCCCIHAV